MHRCEANEDGGFGAHPVALVAVHPGVAEEPELIFAEAVEDALEFAKALYGQMIPGTASWNDASNNKAFLAKEIHWTNNGISIYVAAQNSAKDVAEDMDHAYFPIGPAGKPTELHLMYPILAMTYTKYPQACKAPSR